MKRELHNLNKMTSESGEVVLADLAPTTGDTEAIRTGVPRAPGVSNQYPRGPTPTYPQGYGPRPPQIRPQQPSLHRVDSRPGLLQQNRQQEAPSAFAPTGTPLPVNQNPNQGPDQRPQRGPNQAPGQTTYQGSNPRPNQGPSDQYQSRPTGVPPALPVGPGNRPPPPRSVGLTNNRPQFTLPSPQSPQGVPPSLVTSTQPGPLVRRTGLASFPQYPAGIAPTYPLNQPIIQSKGPPPGTINQAPITQVKLQESVERDLPSTILTKISNEPEQNNIKMEVINPIVNKPLRNDDEDVVMSVQSKPDSKDDNSITIEVQELSSKSQSSLPVKISLSSVPKISEHSTPDSSSPTKMQPHPPAPILTKHTSEVFTEGTNDKDGVISPAPISDDIISTTIPAAIPSSVPKNVVHETKTEPPSLKSIDSDITNKSPPKSIYSSKPNDMQSPSPYINTASSSPTTKDSSKIVNQTQSNSIKSPVIPKQIPHAKEKQEGPVEQPPRAKGDVSQGIKTTGSAKSRDIQLDNKNATQVVRKSSAAKARPKCKTPTEGDGEISPDKFIQGNERNNSLGSPLKSPSKIAGSSRPPSAISATNNTNSRSPSKLRGGQKTPETPLPVAIKKIPMNKVQVGSAPSPNLKTVRSKIGSMDNANHKPGGGHVKIENRKVDFKGAAPKIAAKNDTYTPGGGDKKISSNKLNWSARSKIGSLDNANHKPGGGTKKIESIKLDFKEKAKPKVASKDNIKHIPGGGKVKSPGLNAMETDLADVNLNKEN